MHFFKSLIPSFKTKWNELKEKEAALLLLINQVHSTEQLMNMPHFFMGTSGTYYVRTYSCADCECQLGWARGS